MSGQRVALTAPAWRHLGEDLCPPVGMDDLGQLTQMPVFILGVAQQGVQAFRPSPGEGVGNHALRDDEAEAASGPGGVPGIGLFSGIAQGAGVAHVHGRHGNAVFQLHISDLNGLK